MRGRARRLVSGREGKESERKRVGGERELRHLNMEVHYSRMKRSRRRAWLLPEILSSLSRRLRQAEWIFPQAPFHLSYRRH